MKSFQSPYPNSHLTVALHLARFFFRSGLCLSLPENYCNRDTRIRVTGLRVTKVYQFCIRKLGERMIHQSFDALSNPFIHGKVLTPPKFLRNPSQRMRPLAMLRTPFLSLRHNLQHSNMPRRRAPLHADTLASPIASGRGQTSVRLNCRQSTRLSHSHATPDLYNRLFGATPSFGPDQLQPACGIHAAAIESDKRE